MKKHFTLIQNSKNITSTAKSKKRLNDTKSSELKVVGNATLKRKNLNTFVVSFTIHDDKNNKDHTCELEISTYNKNTAIGKNDINISVIHYIDNQCLNNKNDGPFRPFFNSSKKPDDYEYTQTDRWFPFLSALNLISLQQDKCNELYPEVQTHINNGFLRYIEKVFRSVPTSQNSFLKQKFSINQNNTQLSHLTLTQEHIESMLKTLDSIEIEKKDKSLLKKLHDTLFGCCCKKKFDNNQANLSYKIGKTIDKK